MENKIIAAWELEMTRRATEEAGLTTEEQAARLVDEISVWWESEATRRAEWLADEVREAWAVAAAATVAADAARARVRAREAARRRET